MPPKEKLSSYACAVSKGAVKKRRQLRSLPASAGLHVKIVARKPKLW